VYIYIYIHMNIYKYMYTYVQIYTHTHTYTHTYLYIYIYIYIYTYASYIWVIHVSNMYEARTIRLCQRIWSSCTSLVRPTTASVVAEVQAGKRSKIRKQPYAQIPHALPFEPIVRCVCMSPRHMWMRHVTYQRVTSHLNESRHVTYDWVTSHV